MKLITKSNYLLGLSCPRSLWIFIHNPEKVPKISEELMFRFHQGLQIGLRAREAFPDGILSNGSTNEPLLKRKPVFEPGFEFNGCYAKADILVPSGDENWHIVEVKSTTGAKEEHLHDLAFQKYCYEGAGLKIAKCIVMHINGSFQKDGNIDFSKYFTLRDLSEEVKKIEGQVASTVERLKKIIPSETPPLKCSSPKDCPIPKECWTDLPEDSVFTLYFLGQKASELYESGIVKITEIPETYKLNAQQKIQKAALEKNHEQIDLNSLRSFISKLEYPLHFLDFEAFQTAIPIFDGTKPYQQIPFQFSLHIIENPEEKPMHYFFLADGRTDPRRAFLETLKSFIGGKGSIVVYSKSFEQTVLKELGNLFPERKEWTEQTSARMVDLLAPFRAFHYYHPMQKGSTSIKNVLPAMTKKSYDSLQIKEGELASIKYVKLAYGIEDVDSIENEDKLRKALLDYCKQDTEGMIEILAELEKFTKK